MKYMLSLTLMLGLSACASVADDPVDPDLYSHREISAIVSSKFMTPASDAAQALRPSFAKFGAPQRYVEGNMSSVDEAKFERLYGVGDVHARRALNKTVYWQIDGKALKGDVAPIATVHLIYEPGPLDAAAFAAAEMESRRGHKFTVFERRQGAQIIVSVYPTDRLSDEAEFQRLMFERL